MTYILSNRKGTYFCGRKLSVEYFWLPESCCLLINLYRFIFMIHHWNKYLLFLICLVGCNTQNRIDNSNQELAREIKNSQIKRITDKELMVIIDEWGKEITRKVQLSLASELTKKNGGGAAVCRDLNQLPIVASYAREYGVKIELLSSADSLNARLHSKEKEIMAAYLYNVVKKIPQTDNIQQINDTLFVYNAPVADSTSIASICFPGPQTPFALWRVVFTKKHVIQQIDTKKLKR